MPTMHRYLVLTDTRETYAMTGTSPEHAAHRAADLYGVTVVATKPDPTPTVHVAHPGQIIG